MIKNVSNNDVADCELNKKQLEFRKKDRQISGILEVVNNKKALVYLPKTNWVGFAKDKKPIVVDDYDIPYISSHYGTSGKNVNIFVLASSGFNSKLFTGMLPVGESEYTEWVCNRILELAPSCKLTTLCCLDHSGIGRSSFVTDALESLVKSAPHIVYLPFTSKEYNSRHEKLLWSLYKMGVFIVTHDSDSYPAKYSGVIRIKDTDTQDVSAHNFGLQVNLKPYNCYTKVNDTTYKCLNDATEASTRFIGTLALGLSYILKDKSLTLNTYEHVCNSIISSNFNSKEFFKNVRLT